LPLVVAACVPALCTFAKEVASHVQVYELPRPGGVLEPPSLDHLSVGWERSPIWAGRCRWAWSA